MSNKVMAQKADLLLGRLALAEGLINQDQLYECVLAQERSPRPLGAILVARGYLTEEQLEKLLGRQRAAYETLGAAGQASARTRLLGKLLIEKGLATEFQVNECLRLQASMVEMGIRPVPHLGEIMLKRGYLDKEKLQTALLLQSSEFYTCPECGVPINLPSSQAADDDYVCQNCSTRIPVLFAKMAASLYTNLERASEALDLEVPEEVRERDRDVNNHFGKYVLIQELGRGGAGVVWKAWQRDLNKYVALKILSHESQTGAGIQTPYGDAEDLKRFWAECRAVAELQHPNIVPILDFGLEQNHFYYSMKYIDGQTVDTLVVGTRPPDVKEALRIMLDVARALDYAHKRGVYHRDIKPSNIMVDASRKAWVMDFGLAKIVHLGDPAYVKGVIMGTPYYMPPEQASGDMEQVDHLSDIYSIGAVLYELVTGYCPYAGRNPDDVIRLVCKEPPDPPRKLKRDVPEAVERVVLKAMRHDKRDRYPSCELLVEDLQRCLEDREPVHCDRQTRRSLFQVIKSWFGK